MASLVIDTDVISFAAKGDSRAALYDPHLQGKTLFLSFMTLAELDRWALVPRWGVARRQRFDRYVRRKGRPIDTADAWIGASALA